MQNLRKFHWLFKPWGTNHTVTILTTFCLNKRQILQVKAGANLQQKLQSRGLTTISQGSPPLYTLGQILGTQIQCLCARQYRPWSGQSQQFAGGKKRVGCVRLLQLSFKAPLWKRKQSQTQSRSPRCNQDLQNFTLFPPLKPVSFLTQVTEAQFWCLCKFTLLTKAATEPPHPKDPPEHLQKVGGPALRSTQVLAIPEVYMLIQKARKKVSCCGFRCAESFHHCQRHQPDVKTCEKVKNCIQNLL